MLPFSVRRLNPAIDNPRQPVLCKTGIVGNVGLDQPPTDDFLL